MSLHPEMNFPPVFPAPIRNFLPIFGVNFIRVCKIKFNDFYWIIFNLFGSYRIQQGNFDDFAINNETGLVTIARKLDYDRRDNYRIEIIASDLGNQRLHLSTFYI